MKKAKLKLDIDKLNTEDIPKMVGCDGDDPIIRHLKRLYAEDPDKADLFFERIHKRRSKMRGYEWMDKVSKKDK